MFFKSYMDLRQALFDARVTIQSQDEEILELKERWSDVQSNLLNLEKEAILRAVTGISAELIKRLKP